MHLREDEVHLIAELIKGDDPDYHHTPPFHTDIPVLHPPGV